MNKTTAEALELARHGLELSYGEVTHRVYDRLGPYAPSVETIRAYHQPRHAPKRADLIVLGVLCDIYGLTIKDVAPELVPVLESTRDVVFRSFGWSTGCPERLAAVR